MRALKDVLTSLLENKPEREILFYGYSKRWHGFLYSLHKKGSLILLKMVIEVCSCNECAISIITTLDSQAPIDFLFFLLSMILQQKRIKILSEYNKRDVTLLDCIQK